MHSPAMEVKWFPRLIRLDGVEWFLLPPPNIFGKINETSSTLKRMMYLEVIHLAYVLEYIYIYIL